MKDIFVNGRFLCRKPTGVDRYALEVLRGINQLIAEGHPSVQNQRWAILTPAEIEPPQGLNHIAIRQVGPLNGTLWEQITLPWVTRGQLLLNLCNSAPIYKRRQLVVIHDATTVRVPQAYSKNFARWYKFMIPRLLKRSQILATVSNFSKNEIALVYDTTRKIHVVREGADHLHKLPDDGTVISKFDLDKRPFVLAVGSLAPHKNFGALIQAIEHIQNPEFDCVIAGGVDPSVFATKSTSLPKWVKHVGYVSDSELKTLYKTARCFVFPSIYEGYGLPPTEAMAEGCPVISSNTASMPEICGDAAVYFDPKNPKDLSHILQEITKDPAKLRQMGAAGAQRAGKLNWIYGATDLANLLTNNPA